MMNSENIGWDGKSYFCKRCWKAGYTKIAQVKGHLAMCPGKAIQRGEVPQLAGASWKAAELMPIKRFTSNPAAQLATAAEPQYQPDNELVGRVARLENELAHSLLVNNTPPVVSWFEQNKVMLLFGAFALIILMLPKNKSCECESESEETKKKKPPKPPSNVMSDILTKSANKVANKVVDKTIDKFLGK